MKIAGYDVGFANGPSAAIGILKGNEVHLERVHGGARAFDRLKRDGPYDLIAIDGPITPEKNDPNVRRSVETLFQRGKFQRRCKPGASHVRGTGQQLREAAGEAADKLASINPAEISTIRRVRAGAVVEAFPNAFLGVCISEDVYSSMPSLRRGRKFDWLYEQWTESRVTGRWAQRSSAEISLLVSRMSKVSNHDERAVLVCLVTAACVAAGSFTAIGDDRGGWFYLPPWSMWASWAQDEASHQTRRLKGEERAVEIVRVA